MELELPIDIKKLINNSFIEEYKDFHVSGDTVLNISNIYILKISTNTERLYKEYKKDEWFSKVIVSGKPVKFVIENNVAYYLREYIDGESLCLPKYLNRPILLVKLLKEAIDIFHSIDSKTCPFIVGEGDTVIHGDFCLPNILIKEDRVVGFVDMGDAGVGDAWCDYAWCIWSLEYNLNSKDYTELLLNELNIEFDKDKFIEYTKN